MQAAASGPDVGSSVAAEVRCGDYHFHYSKTYNRKAGTELRILAPRAEQLTGDDAHNRAWEILSSHMDMALWDALLVEQGKEIGGVRLADSDGLARALDNAAGGAGVSGEESALFDAVQAEYERYFTLKTGKPRYTDAQQGWSNTRSARAETAGHPARPGRRPAPLGERFRRDCPPAARGA
ncbi:hypothetical protein [Haliea sp.]|uniref:hypothetical protein n=1 Tax=Haliea sp. TaxID=1932666 RepID=UPI003527C1A7